MSPCVPTKWVFFGWGSLVGEGSNLGSTQKMGWWPIANRCFFVVLKRSLLIIF